MFPSRQRGAALLLVLSALILISVIVIGFLATVRQDRAASNAYQRGSGARQYADTAVNIAVAQIAEATVDPNLAWISQPGLLRTYNTSGPVAAYKLYSSGTMKITGVFNPESELTREVPSDWTSRTNEYVDLNRPIMSGTTAIYPIVTPDAASDVEGFSIDTINAPIPAATDAAYNALPMPVSWIYIRKDGSLVNYSVAATVDDVVARIAFWGDDETCKVNINTASDGVYYDSPVALTATDFNQLANFQPVAQEYQRYPGHPSTTSLAAVIKEIRNNNATTQSQNASKVTPRINWGGSEGATKTAWATKNIGKMNFDRLYPSIDELLFGRNSSGSWATGTPLARAASSLTIDPTKLPFFLTTESRGPELNLLNRPRITIWPFNTELVADPTLLTPEDRLIKMASELGNPDSTQWGPRKLYFQRKDAWHPRKDYTEITENQQLYSYLQWLTSQALPGNPSRTGGASRTFTDKFTALGRDQIITEMFDYLRCQVNNMNRSYEPVAGPYYSFPQGHNLQQLGFNDMCPLLITTDNGETMGFGIGGITLKEFIMQLYNATDTQSGGNNAEKTLDLFNNNTEDPGTDGKADTMIRKVQMVILLDFSMSTETLNSAMPRFQVEMIGPHLYLNPNPNGVPVKESDQIKVRPYVVGQADDAGWSTDAIDLMFPTDSVNLYANDQTQFETGSNTHTFGGALGLAYGLRSNASMDAKDSGGIRDFIWTANRDRAQETRKLFDQVGGDIPRRYSFISRMIEFRIPLALDPSTKLAKTDTITGKPQPRLDPTPVGLEGVPTSSGPLNGTPVDIKVYPGLVKGATKTNQLQPRSDTGANSTLLQKSHLVIANCQMPLPKLGPDSTLIGSWGGNESPYYKYSQLSDYAKRLEYGGNQFPGDMVALVPTGQTEGGSLWMPSGAETRAHMDTFRSYAITSAGGSGGDFRLAAVKRDVPSGWFASNPLYFSATTYQGMSYLPTNMVRYNGTEIVQISNNVSGNGAWPLLKQSARLVADLNYAEDGGASRRIAATDLNGARKANGSLGDFTNGYGWTADGGTVKGPDIGAVSWSNDAPYFASRLSRSGADDSTGTDVYHRNFTGLVYSPWKQIPSAVRFGTLPSRAIAGDPWETLLFNPVPAGGRNNHRGWSEFPRDHYWLDLFYMPVVEPYAITENFATNGKINLNQQIAPFTYIRRNTGLYALLRNMKVLAIPHAGNNPSGYKNQGRNSFGLINGAEFRRPVDLASTVALIQNRLVADNDPFVSASEICEIPMLFDSQSASTIETYWDARRLTGDDSREAPYNALYPRVTTKSNTYKIHFIAQTLQGRGNRWTIASQYRGSQIIERYLDGFTIGAGGAVARRSYGSGSTPDTQFPALAGKDASGKPYYRFRKISHLQFSP